MALQRMIKILTACRQIAFPDVCICCGLTVYRDHILLCGECRDQRFEKPIQTGEEILPASVLHQFSLWTFDKGGYLQDLLHLLKYHHLGNLGKELGEYLGNSYRCSPEYTYMKTDRSRGFILIPVPLHRRKERQRGYNQARLIAEGVAAVTGWKLLPDDLLIRNRNTKSQTGLTKEERTANVHAVFEWKERVRMNEIPVLIDDVFTTGATLYELADMVYRHCERSSILLTLARA